MRRAVRVLGEEICEVAFRFMRPFGAPTSLQPEPDCCRNKGQEHEWKGHLEKSVKCYLRKDLSILVLDDVGTEECLNVSA